MSRSAPVIAAAVLLCALVAPGAVAETPEELFDQGNSAYQQGRFGEAADAYRSALRYRVQDSIVDYNLANAEFKLGNLGQAILYYERARHRDPSDPDIQANLAFARSFCMDRVERPRQAALIEWVVGVQNRVGPDRQAWVLLGVIWAIAGLVAWCFARPGGWTAGYGWGLASLVLVAALAAASWYATFDRLDGQRLAVVQDAAVEVLAGPSPNNPALFTVHEGLTLEVREEREGWMRVSLPNGLNGWISSRSLELV